LQVGKCSHKPIASVIIYVAITSDNLLRNSRGATVHHTNRHTCALTRQETDTTGDKEPHAFSYCSHCTAKLSTSHNPLPHLTTAFSNHVTIQHFTT